MTRKRPKKAEPPKDFPKKKQKVGKGKRTPENATVISFKSQSVVVPIQLEKSNEPTTHRKLGLQVRVCMYICGSIDNVCVCYMTLCNYGYSLMSPVCMWV